MSQTIQVQVSECKQLQVIVGPSTMRYQIMIQSYLM